MIKFLVDFMDGDTTLVKFIHVYTHDDLNECFTTIYKDMVEAKCERIRMHMDREGRWAPLGMYGQKDIRKLLDEDMCS